MTIRNTIERLRARLAQLETGTTSDVKRARELVRYADRTLHTLLEGRDAPYEPPSDQEIDDLLAEYGSWEGLVDELLDKHYGPDAVDGDNTQTVED